MTPRSRSVVRVVAGALGLALGLSWWWSDFGTGQTVSVVELGLFVLAAAVTEMLPMRQPGGRVVPTSVAVIGAAAIIGLPPVVVALIAAAGWFLAWIVSRSDVLDLRTFVLRAVGGWSLAGLAVLGAALVPLRWTGDVETELIAAELHVGAAAFVAVALVLGMPALEAVAGAEGRWRFVLRRIAESVHATWLVGIAVASTAVLGALVHPVLEHWTLPTMLVPLFAARIGLDRFTAASRAYDQTIRAMSRLPEQLGTVAADHGVRVGELARDVGLEFGLDAGRLADLERAAYLHELGRIQLEPDASVTREEFATAGAAVIYETAQLDRVARIVEAHGAPAARRDDEVGLLARIVAACCEVDRYAPDLAISGQRDEVVVRLVREVGDLDVVSALTRVLDRRAGRR